jgi:Flp pilus assembly protein CpaB
VRRAIIILTVALAAYAAPFALCFRLGGGRAEDGGRDGEAKPPVLVVVARADIPAWESLEDPERLFALRQFPEDVAPRDAVSDLAEVKGQMLRRPLHEDQPLLKTDVAPDHVREVLARVKPGRRPAVIKAAYPVAFVRPGSCVDVVCKVDRPDLPRQVILQNLVVLDFAGNVEADGSTAVTLAATPEEASKLSHFARMGELRVLIRRPDDDE